MWIIVLFLIFVIIYLFFLQEWRLNKMKADIKEILFWVFLIISLVILVWIIFGESPTELIFIVTIYLTMLFKMWSVSDRQIRTEEEIKRMREGFFRLADEFEGLKDRLK